MVILHSIIRHDWGAITRIVTCYELVTTTTNFTSHKKFKSTIVDVKEEAKVRMEEEEREEEQEEEPWGEFNNKYENCKYFNKHIIEICT